MAILTVTLNAAIDKIYLVPGFALNQVHRPAEVKTYAGGKGVNVARVFRMLGGEALAFGWLGGRNGEYLQQSLTEEGLPFEFLPVSGETRTCIQILDPDNGSQTEINELGPTVTENDEERLLARLGELLPGRKAVVLSGSIPPGTSPDIYHRIVALAQNVYQVPAVLDSSGAALAMGIEARPLLVKPNQKELAALNIGEEGWGKAASALRERYSISLALVTYGAKGAVLAAEQGVWEAIPPPIDVKSAIGSGDSLTAAFVWAWTQGSVLPDCLAWGVAAGAANALSYGSGFCTRAEIEAVLPGVRVNKLA